MLYIRIGIQREYSVYKGMCIKGCYECFIRLGKMKTVQGFEIKTLIYMEMLEIGVISALGLLDGERKGPNL